MLKKLIVAVLTLTLLSAAMARSVNGTKEERAFGDFSNNGNSQGNGITLGHGIFSGVQFPVHFPWHLFLFPGMGPPVRQTLTTTTASAGGDFDKEKGEDRYPVARPT
ncbi:unnamed protein product [Allacma fusca]|uniref:Uncharacterized protein n=1 Tax=Allacma fusca TaxID=39272 RepID=A0A8J2NTV2_9HEXA|nr:unnamed protein product [Allacma fusca]